MSREIKFRAWIKDVDGDKEFDYVPPMTIQEMIHSKKSTFSLKQLNDLVEFEQFTGLKDKNGRDIYENDLLKFKLPFDKNSTIGQVEWSDKDAGFILGISTLRKIAVKAEVVGNAHEDGQLLGADK